MIPDLPVMEQIVGVLFLAWILVLAWLAALTLFLLEIHSKVRRLVARYAGSGPPTPFRAGPSGSAGAQRDVIASDFAALQSLREDSEILSDSHDLTEMVGRIARKYNLLGLSLASSDGLLIASTEKEGEFDAARYSHIFSRGERPPERGVCLLGVRHLGSDLIAIIRSHSPVTPDLLHGIRNDTEKILAWWL